MLSVCVCVCVYTVIMTNRAQMVQHFVWCFRYSSFQRERESIERKRKKPSVKTLPSTTGFNLREPELSRHGSILQYIEKSWSVFHAVSSAMLCSYSLHGGYIYSE